MYTIKRLADLGGLPVNTVRAWERRYGLLDPARSPSGYRLYSDGDVRVLRGMKALVDRGWPPAEAAGQIRRGGGPGGELVEAAVAVDTALVARLLDEHLALGSFEHAVDAWLMPALGGLGEAWQRGEIGIEGEHAVASVVQRRLSAAFDAAALEDVGHVQVLTGLAAGCRHELGILAFATCLRRRGLQVVHLGADLPPQAWANAVDRHRPSLAVLTVSMPDDAAPVVEVAQAVQARGVDVAVGGAHQHEITLAGVTQLGHSLAAAAYEVEHRVLELVPS